MRITRHAVEKIQHTISTATGDPWIDIGDDLGYGTRYVSRIRNTAEYGDAGAVETLSYLHGVADGRGVDLSEHHETYAYLRTSGRFRTDAERQGREDAERRLSPADFEADNGS